MSWVLPSWGVLTFLPLSSAALLIDGSTTSEVPPVAAPATRLSGIVAESPTAGLAAYSASKAALAAFVQASSREFRRSGIRMLDSRQGHTETGLATRAIAGTAPAFPQGLDPAAVAERIVLGIVDDEKDLPSTAF